MAAANPLKWSDAMAMYNHCIENGKYRDAVMVLLPATTGYRWSDWGYLKWGDLVGMTDLKKKAEKKTGKRRSIPILADVQVLLKNAYDHALSKVPPSKRPAMLEEYVFKPESRNSKTGVMTNKGINDSLTKAAKAVGVEHSVSAHSLRKAFAMRIYELAGADENAMNEVSAYLNHANTQVTRAYLGFTEQRRNFLINQMLT